MAATSQMGIIRLDHADRVLCLDDASARLMASAGPCIGQDWRAMFRGAPPLALEFSVARRGTTGAVGVRISGRSLSVRVHVMEGGTFLVWHDRKAPRWARISKESGRPANRAGADSICFFSIRVSPDNVFTFEALDSAAELATGRISDDVRGRTPHECFPEAEAEHLVERYAECAAAGRLTSYEEVLSMPAGRRRWKTTLVPIRDVHTGRIHRLVGRARDITGRRKPSHPEPGPEALLAEIDSPSTRIIMLDSQGTVVAANAAWQAHLRTGDAFDTNYLFGADAEALTDPGVDEITEAVRAMLRHESDGLCLDCRQQQRWFQLRATWLDTADGRFLVLLCEDTTEARRDTETLKLLPEQLLQARDEERRKIGRELHDSTAQNLVAAGLATERAMRKANSLSPSVVEALTEALDMIRQSLGEIRNISYLLHPPSLDEAGLVRTLSWYVAGVARRGKMKVGLRIGRGVSRRPLPEKLEVPLLRIAQEAVGNAYRHSGASRVEVGLELAGHPMLPEVVLTVRDNGAGLPLAVQRALASPLLSQESLGVGLAGMRERVAQLEGRLTVGPGPHGGTWLEAALPLPPDESDCDPPAGVWMRSFRDSRNAALDRSPA